MTNFLPLKQLCASQPMKKSTPRWTSKSLKGNATGLNMLGIGNKSRKDCNRQIQGAELDGVIVVNPETTVVVSSGDEWDWAADVGTGGFSRVNSIFLCPADMAHFSQANTGDCVEAAKNDHTEKITRTCLTDIDFNVKLPRKFRMKDQFGFDFVTDDATVKRRKVKLSNPPPHTKKKPMGELDSISLNIRSLRLGTLHRRIIRPVLFTTKCIEIDKDVRILASELTSCEWCTVRKLPALFFQTTSAECLRLRVRLRMSRDQGGVWYDCKSSNPDEKYIVLVFAQVPSMLEQITLEEIFAEIGRANYLSKFSAKLSFEEANSRLMMSNRTREAEQQASETITSSPRSPPCQTSTLNIVDSDGDDLHTTSSEPGRKLVVYPPRPVKGGISITNEDFCCEVITPSQRSSQTSTLNIVDSDADDLHTTFSEPAKKLVVYPPRPAKGSISITNEDFHCLNKGEFLNDVIIDFYLKFLVSEKLKKEDANRCHVFSSFFYKSLTQREVPGTSTTDGSIQERRHNRVKTWTRHVDLFQKDFIFIPINQSAHWYLAVICFPGLDGCLQPDPLCPAPQSTQVDRAPQGHSPSVWEEMEGCSQRSDENVSPPNPMSLFYSPADTGFELEQHVDSVQGQSVSTGRSSDALWLGGKELTVTSVTGGNVTQHFNTGYLEESSSSGDEVECTGQDKCTEDRVVLDCQESASKPSASKLPCILIMDSLNCRAKPSVVKILQEYLEVEWRVRKGTLQSFGKRVMKGSSPLVPQQDNFSDCGVYLLQYAESFLKNPPQSFHFPMDLSDWFPQKRVKNKREEIKELILKIQSQQQLDQ